MLSLYINQNQAILECAVVKKQKVIWWTMIHEKHKNGHLKNIHGYYLENNFSLFTCYCTWHLIKLIFELVVQPLLANRGNFFQKPGGDTGDILDTFSDFFQVLQFRVMRQEIFRELFPAQFHKYLPVVSYHWKKLFSRNRAMTQRLFWNVFPNVWK